MIYGDRCMQINLTGQSAWREASGAGALQRDHIVAYGHGNFDFSAMAQTITDHHCDATHM